jgi:hypothetical protein
MFISMLRQIADNRLAERQIAGRQFAENFICQKKLSNLKV